MKFIRDLLGKKRNQAASRQSQTVETLEQSYRDTIGSIVEETNALNANPDVVTKTVTADPQEQAAPKDDQSGVAPASVNIWDLEDSEAGSTELPSAADLPPPSKPQPAAAPEAASAAAARSPARARRTKTRLIGFEKSDGDVVDLFNDAPAAKASARVKFPVGSRKKS